jgi:PAS domain S-box-containing protein
MTEGWVLPKSFPSSVLIRLLPALLLAALAPVYASEPSLSDDELQWLQKHCGNITAGTVVGYQPYAYQEDSGRMGGLAGDYMRLLEERLDCAFQVREYESFAGLLAAAREREVDMVPFAVAAEERQAYLDFTAPFYTISDRILTRTDRTGTLTLDDLSGVRTGIIQGYVLQARLEVERPDIILVPYPNELEAVRSLSFGDIEVLLADSGAVLPYMQREGINNVRVAGDTGIEDYQAIGIRKDWPLLTSAIDKGLASISAEEKRSIERRWLNLSGVDPIELQRLRLRVVTLGAAILFAAVAVFLWNVSLRRLVRARTRQLETELGERQRAEAARARLAIAVEQSAAYVLLIDRNGHIEYANRAFERASGHEDVTGRSLVSMAADRSADTLRRAFADLKQGGAWHGRVFMARAKGQNFRVAMVIVPILEDATGEGGYIASGSDVTLEEQLESQLRQGERLSALGTFAGGIAHDFNNLLMPILGYVDLLRRNSSPEAGSYLDAIRVAGERGRQLVQRILTFSTLHEGSRNPLDMCVEVAESVDFLRSLLPATIEIRSDLSDCKPVLGDKTQIQQILLNLGTNASDAMPHGGRMEIRLAMVCLDRQMAEALPDLEPAEYCLLSVSDSGEGMTLDKQAHIFDPYFTDKPQGKGTGLGLATVHGIVNAHGGVITVNSEPGRGTTFDIYFPVAEGAEPLAAQVERHPVKSTSGKHILVIDDDQLVLDVVGAMLKQLEYTVTLASEPIQALDMIQSSPDQFDAILTDYTMPGLTGLQLAQQVLALAPDIPIVVMTGLSERLDTQGLPCIGKPLRMNDLAECIERILP